MHVENSSCLCCVKVHRERDAFMWSLDVVSISFSLSYADCNFFLFFLYIHIHVIKEKISDLTRRITIEHCCHNDGQPNS